MKGLGISRTRDCLLYDMHHHEKQSIKLCKMCLAEGESISGLGANDQQARKPDKGI